MIGFNEGLSNSLTTSEEFYNSWLQESVEVEVDAPADFADAAMPAVNDVDNAVQEVAKGFFESLAETPVVKALSAAVTYISESRLVKFYNKVDPVSLGTAAYKLGSNCYEAGNGITKKIQQVVESTKSWFETNTIAKNTLAAFKFIPIVLAPFAIHKIVKCVAKIFSAAEGMKKFDAMLAIADKLSWIGEGAISVAEGLEKFGVIAKEALSWTAGVTYASLALSTATIIITARAWYKSHTFIVKAEEALKTPIEGGNPFDENYSAGVQTMLDDPKAIKMFSANADQEAKIRGVFEKHKGNQSKCETIFNNLKNRVKDKIFSHKLTIIAATISLVATVLLLVASVVAFPLAPIAYTIAAVAAIFLIGKWVNNVMDNHQWESWMKNIDYQNRLEDSTYSVEEHEDDMVAIKPVKGNNLSGKKEEHIVEVPQGWALNTSMVEPVYIGVKEDWLERANLSLSGSVA